MTSASEYVLAYQNQTGSGGNDSFELLMVFLISYGMTDGAIDVLCQLIDEEGISPDFGQYLRENGLVIEADADAADEDSAAGDLE
jgi:hypothetical protein